MEFMAYVKKPNAQHRFGNMAAEVLNSSSVLRLNFSNKTAFVLRFPPHRQAEKRCASFWRNENEINKLII